MVAGTLTGKLFPFGQKVNKNQRSKVFVEELKSYGNLIWSKTLKKRSL